MRRLFYFIILFLFLANSACDNESYDGPLITPLTCEEAQDNLIPLQDNFENVNTNNYTELCEEYKAALEEYVSACEETDFELESILFSLGDCELTSFFQVDFDGQTFFASKAEASLENGKISIKGTRGSEGETIELKVNSDSEGAYVLGQGNDDQINFGLYSPDANNINAWQSTNGSDNSQGEIVITEIDYYSSKISGTFNFTAYNSTGAAKEFTSGVFENIALEKGNAFFARVDGVEFVDTQIVPGVNNFGWIGLLAIDNNGEEIFIAVRHNATPGDYSLNQDTDESRFDYSPSFQDFHYGEGTVTVLVHNPETNFLMGTFSCTALPELGGTGTYQITQGEFCVTYFDGMFEDE